MPYAVRLRRVEIGARCSGTNDGTLCSRLTMPYGEHPLTASLVRQLLEESFSSASGHDDCVRPAQQHCRSSYARRCVTALCRVRP